ncbi:MAG: ATP synthase F1 subunit gamma [Oscillospiraceae bacterium]|jgi:F-type H+-transporting ATPase subunit gamma|nr:ATP synthase F1 subunit gamma [Oscillospiraceae bacterium]
MQKTNEIRHHISAVSETRKITNAMHLVASARAKKVIPKMEYNRLYMLQVQSVMKDLLLSPHIERHRYIGKRTRKHKTFIVISGDKGMAGSYNTAVLTLALKEVTKEITASHAYHLITAGMMGEEFFRHRGIVPDKQLGGVTQDPSLYNARQIALDVLERYDTKQTDQVFVIFTPFLNGVAGEPVCHRILPVRISDFREINETEPAHEMLYHPSESEVFRLLVPQYVVGYLFGAMMNSFASEHTSRMLAMQSATRNADEMLDKLRQQYNLARQAAVTQEIAEITSAMFI